MSKKYPMYLTPQKRKFLRACEEQDCPISALMRQFKITRRQLRTWLLRSAFRKRLENLARSAAALRDLEVQRASSLAAQRLAAAFQPEDKDDDADKGLNDNQRKLYVETIRLSRTAPSAPATEPPPRRLAHPALADPDAELAKLQRLRREGR